MAGTANSGGRNRKSAADHRLAGTFQRVRHEGQGAPEPPKGRPAPPKPLSGDARDEWDRMVSRMELSGTSSLVDDAALYQYALLFAETEAVSTARAGTAQNIAALEIAMADLVDGEFVEALRQLVALRQLEAKYMVQIRQGRMALRQYLVEFGMTPSARTRVKVPDRPEAKDPFAEFEGGGGVQ